VVASGPAKRVRLGSVPSDGRQGRFGFPLPRRLAAEGSVTASGSADLGDQDALDRSHSITSAVVDCAVYEDGRRRGGLIDVGEALAAAQSSTDAFAWIGLHDPSPLAVEAVAEHFDLHPLAVEDAVHAHQRPKLEVYGDSLFLVLKTARYVDHDELVDIGEVLVFLGPRFVVTVRHGEASPLHDVRIDLEQHPDLLGIGPSAALYAVADRIVDDYGIVLEGLATDVDEVENEVFSGGRANAAERIYKLKRQVVQFKRAVTPLVGPIERLARGEVGPLDARTGEYFRDVHDHLLRDAEQVQSFDELLNGVLSANLAQLTVRDNQDMRKISAWVAILAVPTMVFAIYGMNFKFMPELQWEYGYPLVLIGLLAVCGALYVRFKRTGWL
jgi:magnesium transporter